MVVYVWLGSIDKMVKYDTLEEYHNSVAYVYILRNDPHTMTVMVEKNTPLWVRE